MPHQTHTRIRTHVRPVDVPEQVPQPGDGLQQIVAEVGALHVEAPVEEVVLADLPAAAAPDLWVWFWGWVQWDGLMDAMRMDRAHDNTQGRDSVC